MCFVDVVCCGTNLSKRWTGTLIGCWLLLSVVLGMDLFSSLHDMEELARHETKLLHLMHSYITYQQSKLVTLVEKYEEFSQAKLVDEIPEEYIGHPVNAFSLIKRLAREWPIILHLMIEHADMPPELMELPGEDDLRGAFRGLARLQEVYRLRTNHIVEGNLDGIHSRYKMSAMDCYEMGKHWYEQTHFPLAQSWFNQALEKISEGDSTVQREVVFLHLYLAVTFSGCEPTYNMAATNNLLHHTIVNHPKLMVSSELSLDFSQALAKNCSWVLNNRRKVMMETLYMGEELALDYSEMCMGLDRSPSTKYLRCHYINHNNPRLLVAPFKVEELHLDPPVLIFHDVASNKEIEDMKISFFSVMKECETVRDNQPSRTLYRTCHVGWVDDSWSETSARLSRRMADMSNLNLESSEINQVASYGLGGEFRPHQDPLINVSLSAEHPVGNRIATMMLYLNDVPSGGRTVFPSIKVSIAPRKGSAVLWFNLDSQSRTLPDMLHGGCPVLRGFKWGQCITFPFKQCHG